MYVKCRHHLEFRVSLSQSDRKKTQNAESKTCLVKKNKNKNKHSIKNKLINVNSCVAFDWTNRQGKSNGHASKKSFKVKSLKKKI